MKLVILLITGNCSNFKLREFRYNVVSISFLQTILQTLITGNKNIAMVTTFFVDILKLKEGKKRAAYIALVKLFKYTL